MPIVADYEVLIGDKPVQIGDDPGGTPDWSKSFKVEKHFSRQGMLLSMRVRGMTLSPDGALVRMDGNPVGKIMPRKDLGSDVWYTETLVVENASPNLDKEVKIEGAIYPGGLDDFFVKDMILTYGKIVSTD